MVTNKRIENLLSIQGNFGPGHRAIFNNFLPVSQIKDVLA